MPLRPSSPDHAPCRRRRAGRGRGSRTRRFRHNPAAPPPELLGAQASRTPTRNATAARQGGERFDAPSRRGSSLRWVVMRAEVNSPASRGPRWPGDQFHRALRSARRRCSAGAHRYPSHRLRPHDSSSARRREPPAGRRTHLTRAASIPVHDQKSCAAVARGATVSRSRRDMSRATTG